MPHSHWATSVDIRHFLLLGLHSSYSHLSARQSLSEQRNDRVALRLAWVEDADHLPAIETAAGELFKTTEGLAVDATASVTIDGRDVNAKGGEDDVEAKIKVD